MKHIYILATLLLTVYGQIVIKSRSTAIGSHAGGGNRAYLLKMLTDPLVVSCFVAAVLAAISWLMAVRYFEVAYAYPFMALSFVLVPVTGWLVLGETLGPGQILGSLLIVGGLAMTTAWR